jgi:hypothetical protein
MSLATDKQITPHGDVEILPLVLADLKERSDTGIKKYGEPLKANNGRDALVDVYQEILDAAMYIRQKIYEERGY